MRGTRIHGLLCLGTAASVWANLTPYSGSTLKRPILFVHGINANMTSWGAHPAELICKNPVATFNRMIYQYVPIHAVHMNNVPWEPNGVPMWDPTSGSGPAIPAPVPNAPGQVWRDLPAGNGYFQFQGTTNAPTWGLAKVSSTQSTQALPPNWAFSNPSDMNMMQIITGYEYRIACDDGSVHIQNSAFPPGLTGAGSLQSWAKSSLELQWSGKSYALAPNAWKNGYVQDYKPESGLARLAAKYNLNTSPDVTADHSSNINHNGLELYTATNSTGDAPDAFCRPDNTDGVVHNSILNKDELGQTNQLLARMSQVLDEYYPDWKTNSSVQIDVVCHSQGCLVTRNAVRTSRATALDNPINHIHAIVGLNSPELGTAIATDKSGVPVIEEVRSTVYYLYKSGLLDPIRVKVPLGPVDFDIKEFDPLASAREMAKNFTNTDQYLAYPESYPTTGWEPPTSNIGVASGICGTPTVSYLNTTVLAASTGRNPKGTRQLKYNYTVICADGHQETASQYALDFSQADVPKKPSALPPEFFIPSIKSSYNGAKYGPYGLRSAFMTDLVNANPVFPTRPATGAKIPFTSYWGTVPGLGMAYLALAQSAAEDVCHDVTKWEKKTTESLAIATLLFPDIGPFTIPVMTTAGTDALMPMGTCDAHVYVIFNILSWMMSALDDNWSQYSDFVVDKSSQQIKGLFKKGDPYKLREYALQPGEIGVPHMDFPFVGPGGGALQGACNRGDDYYNAIEDPPSAGWLSSILNLLQ